MTITLTDLEKELGTVKKFLSNYSSDITVHEYEVFLNHEENEFAADVFFNFTEDGESDSDREESLTRHFETKDEAKSYAEALQQYVSSFASLQIFDNTTL